MPVFRRFGRPGLLDSVARTAVVTGTAAMTARAVNRGLDGRSPARDGEGVEPDAAHAAGGPESVPTQLGALAALHDSGAISDNEFVRAKKRVLGG